MEIEYARAIEELLGYEKYFIVGKSTIRIDALEKVTGKAKYTTDYITDEALCVKILRSPHPHAVIKGIHKDEALKIPGVVAVLTADDIPGVNDVGYYLPDHPLLVKEKARFVGDPIALIAAKGEDEAIKGLEAAKVDYEKLPAIFDPEESLRRKDVKIHEHGNVAGTVRVVKGDVDAGFAKADVIVENTYSTSYQDHAYIETEAAIAIPDGYGKLTVIGNSQNPFRTRDVIAKILGWNNAQVRLAIPYIGGGFGGKDTMGPIICSMAALVAAKTGMPAALAYSREESLAYHFKRAPFKIRYKSGATKDGKLVAIDVDYVVDVGAYATQGVGLMRRAAYHATGPYEVPNVKVKGVAVYTNKIPPAAFNGFGNPQMQFAAESQMDLLAEKLGIDPVEFRLMSALVPGSRTGTNQLLDHSVGIKKLITKVAEVAQWKEKKKAKKGESHIRRGIGIGCSWHGCGTTGVKQDWAGASIIINPDGSVTYRTGIVEIGQGTQTSHAMMVAEILGIPVDWVRVEMVDTASVPDSGETHAQRGTMIAGTAAVDAALKLRRRLNKLAAEILECDEKDVVIKDGKVFVKGHSNPHSSVEQVVKEVKSISFKALAKELYMRGLPPAEYGFIKARRGIPDPETGLGEPYAAYTFGCCIAEVEVDMEIGEVNVLKIYPGVAAGKIINPEAVKGQIYGCALMGLGMALMENVVIENGIIKTVDFTDYVIPTIKDKPDYAEPVYVEDEYRYSGFGAKGVGEIALIAIPPAIVNAIYDATGVRFYDLPLSSEKIFFRIRGERE